MSAIACSNEINVLLFLKWVHIFKLVRWRNINVLLFFEREINIFEAMRSQEINILTVFDTKWTFLRLLDWNQHFAYFKWNQHLCSRALMWQEIQICNISKAKQMLAKKYTGHCLTHLLVNKTTCEIWSICGVVQFDQKYLTPFFHQAFQLLLLISVWFCKFITLSISKMAVFHYDLTVVFNFMSFTSRTLKYCRTLIVDRIIF